ncbi:MAG: spore coat protein [Faecalibacterium sp.]
MALTAKEKSLLKDLKKQSTLSGEKYECYTECAGDKQLIELCKKIGECKTKTHELIMKMDKGEQPTVPKCNPKKPTFKAAYSTTASAEKKHDAFICNDLLSNEKYLAGLYNTCIFEFTTDENRAVLNYILTETQRHGKLLYDYMSTNHMMS